MPFLTAVVLTHNRLPLLKQCIEGIRSQTLQPSMILVVNNGCTDGTAEWLQQQNDLHVVAQENLGSSGGFHRGIREAYELQSEWIWIMDDDAVPDADCLEQLMHANTISNEKFKVLMPIVWQNNRIDKLHHGNFVYSADLKCLQRVMDKFDYSQEFDIYPVDFGSFVGLLFHRSVPAKIGYPMQPFFIYHDDTEYCVRIKEHFGKIALVKKARIDHRVQQKVKPKSERSILGYSFEDAGFASLGVRYFAFRNLVYLKQEYFRKHSFLKRTWFPVYLTGWYIYTSAGIIRRKKNKMIQLRFFYHALLDGLKGIFDNQKPFRIVLGKKDV